MDEVDALTDAREILRIRRGSVPAAEHAHAFPAKEVAIAGRAIRHAASCELVFPRKAHLARPRARRHDDASRLMLAERRRERLHLAREVDRRHFLAHDGRAEALRLLLHRPSELEAVGAFGKARVVFHPLGLRKLSTRGNPLINGNREPRARRIEPCRESRRPRADHRHVEHVVFVHGISAFHPIASRSHRVYPRNAKRRCKANVAPQRLPIALG